MRAFFHLTVVLMVASLGGVCVPTGLWADQPASVKDPVGTATGATVLIKVDRMYRGQPVPTSGSGFLIDSHGTVLTNWHVVAPQIEMEIFGNATEVATSVSEIDVVVASGTREERTLVGRVVSLDRERDLALLKVQEPPPFRLEIASAPAKITDAVTAVGYPFGDLLAANNKNPEVTVTMGHVTSIRHDPHGLEDAVQIDAAVNPGNSGGPLLDNQGRVVGIIRSAILEANATSFAIPLDKIRGFIHENLVRVALEPDAIWNRADPVKVHVAPLLVEIVGFRCEYTLEGGDIQTASGEIPWGAAEFVGLVHIPAVIEGRPKPPAYQLTLRIADGMGQTIVERRCALALREGMASTVRSDRDPYAMMKDRRDYGNRTESSDAPWDAKANAAAAAKGRRTALSDVAKGVKVQKSADGATVVTNQDLNRCLQEAGPGRYSKLDDEGLVKLAQMYDEVECQVRQLKGNQASSSTSASRYGGRDGTGVRGGTHDADLARLTQELDNVRAQAIDKGLCRCTSGNWYNRYVDPACKPCEIPR